MGVEISPIRLLRRIKNGLEIPGLKEALIKILQDFHLQISLLEGCGTILAGDCADLTGRLQKGQGSGFLLTGMCLLLFYLLCWWRTTPKRKLSARYVISRCRTTCKGWWYCSCVDMSCMFRAFAAGMQVGERTMDLWGAWNHISKRAGLQVAEGGGSVGVLLCEDWLFLCGMILTVPDEGSRWSVRSLEKGAPYAIKQLRGRGHKVEVLFRDFAFLLSSTLGSLVIFPQYMYITAIIVYTRSTLDFSAATSEYPNLVYL